MASCVACCFPTRTPRHDQVELVLSVDEPAPSTKLGAKSADVFEEALSPHTLYTSPEPIFQMVARGEVVLLRATWILQGCGYTEIADGHWKPPPKGFCVQPLPCRQQLEATANIAAAATVPADELRANYARFRDMVSRVHNHYDGRSAQDDGVDALPVVSVSHCWETADMPDPTGRTLASVAHALAAQWPLFRRWGFHDVGVFFDWGSLYQNKPVLRTPAQEQCFRAALAHMSVWYAHSLTAVYIVEGQEGLALPREARGWPFYEEMLACLFKDEPRGTPYAFTGAVAPEHAYVPEGPGCLFRRVLQLGWRQGTTAAKGKESTGPAASQSSPLQFPTAAALHAGGMAHSVPLPSYQPSYQRKPPLAPSRFDEEVRKRTFTNGADALVVSGLYRECVHSGFASLDRLLYPRCGWDDAQIDDLATLLEEAPCLQVTVLKLTMHRMSTLEALDRAIALGALTNLRKLICSSCSQLTALPASLHKLQHLEELYLDGCIRLYKLPPLPPSLKLLDGRGLGSRSHGRANQAGLAEELVKLKERKVTVRGIVKLAERAGSPPPKQVQAATSMQAAERGRLGRQRSRERRMLQEHRGGGHR